MDAISSYVTLEEAQCYFDLRLYSEAWQTASRQTRIQALSTATTLLEEIPWLGRRESENQEFEWPRILKRDGDAEFPKNIKKACYELALNLLSNETVLDQETERIKRVRSAKTEVEFFEDIDSARVFPSRVMDLLDPYIDFSRWPGRTVEVWRFN